MEIIFKKALKSKLIFLAIFLCIPSYTKEYKDLFNVYYPIDSTSNIQKTLNESFNVMVFRLSGSSSPSNIWKIINAGNPREKYILSYTSKRIDDKSYLVTNFNQELFMQTFLELDIPLVGYSRPSILLLLNIQDGINEGYFLSSNNIVSNDLNNALLDLIQKIELYRGVFVDLPELDLIDMQKQKEKNFLTQANDSVANKYNYDELINIELVNTGINAWEVSGDISKSAASNITEGLLGSVESLLKDKIDKLLAQRTLKSSSTSIVNISIIGINTFEDYKEVKNSLNKSFITKDISLSSYNNNEVKFKVEIYGTEEDFKSDFSSLLAFNFLEGFDEYIKYRYIND